MPKRVTDKPKLVNRGAAGLLKKVPDPPPEANGHPPPAPRVDPTQAVLEAGPGKKNYIRCEGRRVKIASLVPDPENARVHGDRNMAAIKASLKLYGQMKPIVVRQQDMVVAAGNGTLRAATELGWSEVAASVIKMSDEEFSGYALADNRTAELAAWDFEVVAKIDQFLQERGQATVGWTADELEVLRAADWTPPDPSDDEFGGGDGDGADGEPLLVSFTPDQYYEVKKALDKVREKEPGWDQAQCLTAICKDWHGGVS